MAETSPITIPVFNNMYACQMTVLMGIRSQHSESAPLLMEGPVNLIMLTCCMPACDLLELGIPGGQAGAERDLDSERLMETKT